MNALMIEPMKEPREVQIEPGLESLQRAVAGDIEAIYPFQDSVALIVNEEGKLNHLPLNRALRDEAGEIYDILAGNILVVGLGPENFTDLPAALMQKYKAFFKDPEQFMAFGHKIIAVKRPVRQEKKEAHRKRDMER